MNRVAERRPEFRRMNFKLVSRPGPDAVCERQGGGAEEMDVHAAGTQELRVFEMMVFQVFQRMAHIVFAGKKRFFPDRFPIADYPADASDVGRHFPDE